MMQNPKTSIQHRDADLVMELLDKAIQMETPDRKTDFEKAAKLYHEKHGNDWRDFITPSLDRKKQR